ncbi:DUF4148 domain-containing protein [Acidovorax sp. NCPPB 4044]|uniref:DUF4148 domain-containing protein n=1 Tax=Acidovorax sp. NCPPB 4044 TaxID=2940490 RepID=UPI00230218AC|nr:DUF4148 domain-containing protein [Acidovorax sp. NCPPB 4044]MDA8523519.1 DUF4148 domain-containing protein [Acidovorax sp. NCPPB 4044]
MQARKTSALLLSLAALAFVGVASAAPTSQEDWFGAEAAAQGPSLTRAEVVADLVLWNRAGLNHAGEGDRTAIADADYRQRVAEYRRLRSGPEFLAEVRRQGGDTSAVAGQNASTGGN